MSKFYKQRIYKKYKDEIWGKIISKRFSYNRKALLLNYRDNLLKNRLRIKTKFKYFRRGFLKHLNYSRFMFKGFKKRVRLFNFWKKSSFYSNSFITIPHGVKIRRKVRRRFRRFAKITRWNRRRWNIKWMRKLVFKPLKALKMLYLNMFFLKFIPKFCNTLYISKPIYLHFPKYRLPIFFSFNSNKSRVFYKTYAFLRKNAVQFNVKKKLNLRKQKIFFYSIHIAAPQKKKKKRSLFALKNIYYKKISLFFGFKSTSTFLKIYNRYAKTWGINNFVAFSLLEFRLETFLLRLNLFPSVYFIKNFVLHKNVFVNNSVVNCSSYILKLNEIVSFNRRYYKRLYAYIKYVLKSKKIFLNVPGFIEVDYKLLVAMPIRRPELNSLTKPMSFDLYTNFPTFHR